MLAEVRTGLNVQSDGTVAPARATRIGALATGDAQGKYYEQTSRGNVFSLWLAVTTAAPTAGQQNGASGGGATQFCLWNPASSGKNLSLLKFVCGVSAGTTPSSPLVHSYGTAPTIATTVVNPIVCNNVGMSAATVARAATHASTGVTLTGGGALTAIRLADSLVGNGATFANTSMLRMVEYVDGDIVIPPGFMWVPTWGSAGTNFYCSYSVTWEELPI